MKKTALIIAFAFACVVGAIGQDTTIYYPDSLSLSKAIKTGLRGYEFNKETDVHNVAPYWAINYHKRSLLKSSRSQKADSLLTPYVVLQYYPGKGDFAKAYCKDAGAKIIEDFPAMEMLIVRISSPAGYQSFRAKALAVGIFSKIEQDKIVEAESETNDFYFNSQWAIPKIKAVEAWAQTEGMPDITVAMFDGHGYETTHEDFLVNVVATYDAVTQTTSVLEVSDYEKHGTACAGIIGATSNNSLGVAGLGNNHVKMILVRIGYAFTSSGSFQTSTIIQLRAYAFVKTHPECRVISQSFGSTSSNIAVQAAITDIIESGVVVVASTGNAGLKDTWRNFPASYGGVIAVGSTNSADLRSSFANHGKGLTLSAPGSGIHTLDRSGKKGYKSSGSNDPRIENYNNTFSGTSASTPVVAATVAYIFRANPSLDAYQAREILIQSCDKVGGYLYVNGWSEPLGYGRVNMNNAVTLAKQFTPPPIDHSVTLATCLIPSSVQAGQSISVSCRQVTNRPSGPAIDAVVEYLWSTDALFTADDILIGADTSHLGGGTASENETFTYQVPGNAVSGYIVMRTISAAECSGVVTVTYPTTIGVDGLMEIVSVSPITADGKVDVKYRVYNSGSVKHTSHTYKVFLKGTNANAFTYAVSLDPDKYSLVKTSRIQLPLTPGTYTIEANLTKVNGVLDVNQSNNVATIQVVRP